MENKMKMNGIRVIAAVFICALLMPSLALGQKDPKKQDKEVKENAKDEKRLDKTIKKYEETLVKANDKYLKDDDFREDVDFEFRRLRREHATMAFDYNTNDRDDWVVSNSGDRLPKNTDTLYDNLMAQDYVNRVGQSLVPANSEKRYGFKITVNPMPDARSLSTGTVYISTGLLSFVDNEAQLAYILGHEIAHVERDHWREDVLVAQYIEDATKSAEKKGKIFGAVAGGITGGLLGGSNIADFVFLGAALGKSLSKIVSRNAFEWSGAQEDEADKIAMSYMLERTYDVRETQTFYEDLRKAAIDDPRIELDRFGDRKRSEERRKYLNTAIASSDSSRMAKTVFGATNLSGKSLSMTRNLNVVVNRMAKNQEKMSEEMKTKIQNGEIMAGDGEFEDIMSAIKRDNGIVAFYYDMYKLSARNLSQALAIRSDDSLGYFYYGKVLKLTARKSGEKEEALQMFRTAIDLDKRNTNPQSRLYYALTKMGGRSTNNIQEIVSDLKQYVALYQQMNGGALPPSMNVIYDYMQEAGENNWSAVAVTHVKNVGTAPVQAAPATAAPARKP
jgi:tetratricopeptide (TPR) repeat protein